MQTRAQCRNQNKILIVLGQKVCTISAMLKLSLYVSPARTRDPRPKYVGIDANTQLNEPRLTRYDIFDRFCRGSNEIEVHRTTRARGLRTVLSSNASRLRIINNTPIGGPYAYGWFRHCPGQGNSAMCAHAGPGGLQRGSRRPG